MLNASRDVARSLGRSLASPPWCDVTTGWVGASEPAITTKKQRTPRDAKNFRVPRIRTFLWERCSATALQTGSVVRSSLKNRPLPKFDRIETPRQLTTRLHNDQFTRLGVKVDLVNTLVEEGEDRMIQNWSFSSTPIRVVLSHGALRIVSSMEWSIIIC